MNTFVSYALHIRARLNRIFRPAASRVVSGSVEPVSTKFGFDRGTPIDRRWIEQFVAKYADRIHGSVLEIGDNRYTKQFGKNNVQQSDILDIDKKNKQATLYGDLRNLSGIATGTYDCVILTHVLGIVDDYESAFKESYRIVKKGGTVLVTVSSICPTFTPDFSYWRFTPASLRYIVKKLFPRAEMSIDSYGNVLSGQWFWIGMAQEEVDTNVLDFHDVRYPCAVGVCITKR